MNGDRESTVPSWTQQPEPLSCHARVLGSVCRLLQTPALLWAVSSKLMVIDSSLAGSVYILPTFREELPAVACPSGLLSHPREERGGLHSTQGWLPAMQHLQTSCPLLPCACRRSQWPACRRERKPALPPVGFRSPFPKIFLIMSWAPFAALDIFS